MLTRARARLFLFYLLKTVMVNAFSEKNRVLELTLLLPVISGGRSRNRATNYVSTRQILPSRCTHIPSEYFLKLRKWYLPWKVRLSTNRKRKKKLTSMFINFYPLNPNLNSLAVIRSNKEKTLKSVIFILRYYYFLLLSRPLCLI